MRFYSKRDLWIGILLLVLPMILWVTVIVVSSGPFFNLFYGIMMAFWLGYTFLHDMSLRAKS